MNSLMYQIAFKLADKQAIDVILEECPVVIIGGVVWKDSTKPKSVPHVMWEVKYLHIRGLLCKHPQSPWLVKIRGMGNEKAS